MTSFSCHGDVSLHCPGCLLQPLSRATGMHHCTRLASCSPRPRPQACTTAPAGLSCLCTEPHSCSLPCLPLISHGTLGLHWVLASRPFLRLSLQSHWHSSQRPVPGCGQQGHRTGQHQQMLLGRGTQVSAGLLSTTLEGTFLQAA